MSWRGAGGCALSLVVAFVLVTALAWLLQRRMIYLPYPSAVRPVEAVLPGGREVVLSTADGLELGAWFVGAGGGPARGAVVVFNGNAGNRSLRAELAAALAALGVDVLLFDYRGYGGNPGVPGERGLLADARAARRWLEERGVEAARIVYFGESLGAAVAVALAAETPPAGLVLRSPFASLADVGRYHYPFLPVGLLLRDRYPSVERIGSVGAPVLVILGERDTIVPPAMSRELFAAAREPKRLVVVEGVGHNDFELLAGERMLAEIAAFFDAVLPPR